MDSAEKKVLLPPPCFQKSVKPQKQTSSLPHFMSPQGMLLPREHQPPPMYGPRGATIPPKFLGEYKRDFKQKRDRDETYCESCELDFKSAMEMQRHSAEHRVCGIGGCSFAAQPAIVEKHVEMQHSSGLYERIRKLETPEEIEKWRQERKKRYPTKRNIELRQKAQEERMKRGERLEKNQSRFGRQEDRRPMERKEEVVSKEKKSRNRRQRKPARSRDDDLEARSIEPSFKDFKEVVVEEKDLKEVVVEEKKPEEKQTNALSSLLGMYGSDSDESEDENDVGEMVAAKSTPGDEENNKKMTEVVEIDEVVTEKDVDEPLAKKAKIENSPEELNNEVKAPEETIIAKTSDQPDKIVTKTEEEAVKLEEVSEKMSKGTNSDDEAPEETSIAKTSELPDKIAAPKLPPATSTTNSQPNNRQGGRRQPTKPAARRHGLNYDFLRTSNQNTMLEKLLESEIRHERNVLLQCVRFVVENDFFDVK